MGSEMCIRDRAISYAKDRTIFISQFEEGKIYDNEVIFKSQQDDRQLASLKVKVQYIKDEQNLIQSILELCENKRKLLSLLLKK